MGASAKPKHQPSSEQQQGVQVEVEEIFRKGSVVEVSTDEEGFKDAWFVATVIEPPSPPPPKAKKNPNHHHHRASKVYVQYKTLYADENLSQPLRESVPVRFIRPFPPTQENPPPFQLNDIVDAYYRDGWWTGVITRVIHVSSRFVVTFRSPPDEIEFGLSDLRHHLDWVSGSWVCPNERKRSGLMYSVGDNVEVSLDKEDVWFSATVVEVLGIDSVLVELQADPGEPELHKVPLGYPHIRPCPPVLKDRNFVLFDKVEAFYGFGWRGGVITKELADSRYVVFFKNTKTDAEFNHSELRPPLHWKDGKWVTASQDVIVSYNEKPEGLLHSDPKETSMDVSRGSLNSSENNSEGKKGEERPPLASKGREDKNEELSSGHESLLNITTSPKKRPHNLPSDSGKMLLQPVEKLKKGVDAAVSSVIMCHQKTIASEKQPEGMVSSFDSPPTSSTGANLKAVSLSGDQPSDNPSWGKKTFMQHRKRRKIDAEENRTWSSKKKTGTPIKLLFKKPESPSTRLECIKMSGSRAGETRKLRGEERLKLEEDQKQQRNDPSVHNKVLQAGESNQKRKRGRPRKLLVRSLETLVTEQNGNNAEEEVIVKDCVTSEVDSLKTTVMVSMSVEGSASPKEIVTYNGDGKQVNDNQPTPKNESGNTMKMSPARMPTEKNDQASIRQHEKHSSKRARKRMANISQNFSIEDSSDAAGRKISESICTTKEVKMVVEERTNDMLDDQPLSKWFEGMQCPSNVDGARISPARIMEQSTELSKRQELLAETPTTDDEGTSVSSKRIFTDSPAVGKGTIDKSTIVLSINENLPFVKNTTLWAAVESMEVFRKMPQKPHFRPLEMYKESSREGLAIACMVTFSSAVEKISNLQFDDPREKIDDILDSLNDLESHGFDVQGIRDRIDELLSIKVDNKKIDDETAEIKSQIAKCHLEKADKDKEIAGIKKQIEELQDKLLLAESVMQMKDGEIASLQLKLAGLEQSLASARTHFLGLAAGVL